MDINLKNGVYHLTGRVDEYSEFDHLSRAISPLKLNLGKVTAINSIGVRKFLAFALTWAPKKMEFFECTPEFISNVNVIPQLVGTIKGDAPIKSFFLPFSCSNCKRTESTLQPCDQIKFSANGETIVPEKACPKCGEPMELDAERSEYFIFLERQRA